MEYAHEFVVAERYARQNGIFYGSILTCNFDEDIVATVVRVYRHT